MVLVTTTEKKYIHEHINDDVRDLALRMKENEDFRPKFVLQQIAGIQAMKRKMPQWAANEDIIYPVHLSLEQCSSEFTTRPKSDIIRRYCDKISEKNYADLTGGFGVDFSVMSAGFGRSYYVERNNELCEIAANNFNALKLENYEIINGDGVEFLKNFDGHFGAVFIDPARRSKSGSKIVRISDCEPDVVGFQDVLLEKTDIAIIKLSPMLDISECTSQLKNVAEIHVVGVDGECKELLAVLIPGFNEEPKIFVYDTDRYIHIFLKSDEANGYAETATNLETGMYLYEPNAAIMKAAPFNLLAEYYFLEKISDNSHLYVSKKLIDDFPGRRFKIMKIGGVKDFKHIEKANITVRNFPMKADELRKKMKIKDGGDIYLFATTMADGRKIMLETARF
ncbi:MAG: SAM-dependent methyltransferase [Bacteroidales bacterium]|nr:SAM-dependent methyltransferase [Bacteroidales bacterium]